MRIDRKAQSPKQLAEYLRDGTLGLPDFQRPSVWSGGQQRDLLDSLLRRLSIGVITLWEVPTNSHAKCQRPFFPDQTRRGHKYLVLDGQQRLRAMAALCDRVDPFQRKPKQVVIDQHGELKLRKATVPESRAIGLLPTPIAAKGNLDLQSGLTREQQRTARRVHEALTSDSVTVVVVPLRRYEDAIELFERINSRGQRLAHKDLIAARLAESYPDFITDCDQIAQDLTEGDGKQKLNCFDRMVLTRLVAFSATGEQTAQTKEAHEVILEALHQRKGAARGRKIPTERYLREVRLAAERLRKELITNFGLGGDGTEAALDGSAAAVAIQYLRKHKNPPQRDLTLFRRWLFLMLFSNYYTGGPSEAKISADIQAVSGRRVPWTELIENAAQHMTFRGVVRKASPRSVKLNPNPDFFAENRNRKYLEVLRRITLANASLLGWLDRDRTCRLHDASASKQHIFPKNPRGTRKIGRGVNLKEHPANFATIDKRDNSTLTNRPPHEYLTEVPYDSRRQQLIPPESFWAPNKQKTFLDRRTRMIIKAVEKRYGRRAWT